MSAVTFDVWHTLLHLFPVEEEAYYRAQVDLAVEALQRGAPDPATEPPSARACADAYERALRDAEAASREGRSVRPSDQLRSAGASVGRRPDAEEYVRRLEELVARQPFRVAPGAPETLAEIRRAGYRVGVVSNTVGETGRAMHDALERLGLARSIEAFAFSEELPWAKPAPEIFRYALAALATPPGRAVHVGDSWPDLEGARRAELRGSIYFTGLQRYGPHYQLLHVQGHAPLPTPSREVRDFAELLPVVRTLLP